MLRWANKTSFGDKKSFFQKLPFSLESSNLTIFKQLTLRETESGDPLIIIILFFFIFYLFIYLFFGGGGGIYLNSG